MRRNEYGGAARAFGIFLLVILVVAMGAAVFYLLSDRNARHYRIASDDGVLVVEKGDRDFVDPGLHRQVHEL